MSQVVSSSSAAHESVSLTPPPTPPLVCNYSSREPTIMSPTVGKLGVGGAQVHESGDQQRRPMSGGILPRVAYDPDMRCPTFYGSKIIVVGTESRGLVFLDPQGAKDPLFLHPHEVAEFVKRAHEVLKFQSTLHSGQYPKDGVIWSYELRQPPDYPGKFVLNMQVFQGKNYIWLKFLQQKAPNFFSGTKAMARLDPEDLAQLLPHLTRIYGLLPQSVSTP